jgi:2-oxoglutarate dehydrogenase E2 component (dihydrolipoamide succinyltransferase)
MLLQIVVPQGETVEVGTLLAWIGETGEEIEGEATPQAAAPAAIEPKERMATPTAAAAPAQNGPSQVPVRAYAGRVSPVVGRIAAEHKVDLNRVPGSGRDGRITKKDILAYVDQRDREATAGPNSVTAATTRPAARAEAPAVAGELVPLTNIRRSIAEHMVRSKQTSPHVTTVFDVDFTAVFAHRAANKEAFGRDGVNLTYTAYIVAAMVQAVKAYPIVNSSWTDEGILIKREINIGVATAIANGLIVPVIKSAEGLNLLGLARAVNDLADRARDNKLRPDEVQGGTLSLTNHGVSGSLFATPIINQPQTAIVGVGKVEKRVKVIDDAIAIRPMAFASLTFDHRILDGATADHFMSAFKETLEGWK